MARRFFALLLFGMTCLLLSGVVRADSTVVFNEIMYRPVSGHENLAWIEFHNQMAVDMDISDWTVRGLSGGLYYGFPEGTVVPGGGFLVLAASPAALEDATGFAGAIGPFAGELLDAGDRLELSNNNERLMDWVRYADRGDWPVAAAGSGLSLAKLDKNMASRDASNWAAAEQVGGTPGGQNFTFFSDPVDAREGLISYWAFDEAVIGRGEYETDFDEPDGTPENWVVNQAEAVIQGGALALTPGGSEPHAFAAIGEDPIFFGDISLMEFDLTYPGSPGAWPYDHGGVLFCCQDVSNRWLNTGYYIDYLDGRWRIIKMINGVHTQIGGAAGVVDYEGHWTIALDGPTIRLLLNNVEQCAVDDEQFRSGYVGFWAYTNGGQEMHVDDVQVSYTGLVLDGAGGNNGPAGNGVDRVAGLLGDGALRFDGTQDAFVNVGAGVDDNFSVSDGLSLEALIRPTWDGALGSYAMIFDKADAGRAIQLGFKHEPEGQHSLFFGLQAGGEWRELAMPLDGMDGRPALPDLTDGETHHVAATYDAASGIQVIYVDGSPRFSAQIDPSSPLQTGGNADGFIGNAGGGGRGFQGVMDELAFWARALPAHEVARHVDNTLQGHTYFLSDPGEEGEPPGPPVFFNETYVVNQVDAWVELVAPDDRSVDLSGCAMVRMRPGLQDAEEYVLPATHLGPGDFLVLTEATLGFSLAADDRLFLFDPDRRSVLAACLLQYGLRARFAADRNAWGMPAEATPDAGNLFSFQQDVVITEIMYHPMADPDEFGEFVELYNRGDSVVDLSSFRFESGIDFVFPDGVALAPGKYLVVARNPAYLMEVHGLAQGVVGPYDLRLGNGGELLRLVDGAGNPVDEVRYRDGGEWPGHADGGGSSLELRDIRADNRFPGAWAASDETAASQWQAYVYEGVARSNRGPTVWREFVMGLLDDGEVLLDDISVVESPDGANISFLKNGDFEDGETAWRILGNHRHSRIIEDPDQPGNHVLHLVATGATEHMHNHLETTFGNNESVVNGRTYRISFRAKWLRGSNLLNTRLYFNRLPRTTAITIPAERGTPGRINSQAVDNVGPALWGLRHFPPVPEADQSVSVSVMADDPDGVKACALMWSVDGGAWHEEAMMHAGGRWFGIIPGQARGRVVQFYVQAEDLADVAAFSPPAGPDSRALFKVNDDLARFEKLHNLRIIMLSDDSDFMHEPINVMSNESMGATVIYDEQEVFYDVGVRLKSSQRGRLNANRVGFNIAFKPERLFRGVHRTVGIDRAGGVGIGMSVSQDEIIAKHIVNHAGGIPGMYDDIVRIIAPRPQHTSNALLMMARYNDVYLGSQYQNGEAGHLFTYELIYYPTSTHNGHPEGFKLPQPDSVTGVDIQDLGDDKESYRWFYLKENNRAQDDYSALMNFCKEFAAPSNRLEEAAAAVIDVDQWMRAFAMYSLCSIGDTYSQGLEHNNMHYVRPSDGRVLIFPWDMDFTFSRAYNAPIIGNGNVARIINLTPNRRMFYRHLHDIMETTFNLSYMSPWVDHYGDKSDKNYGIVKTKISQRASYVRNALPLSTPFIITEVNDEKIAGGEIEVNDTQAVIEGRAPFTVAELRLNGLSVTPYWTSFDRWTVEIPLDKGPNILNWTALDLNGNVLEEITVTVTSTVDWHPPRVFAFMPIQGPASGGTEVHLYGENFQPETVVHFGGVTIQDITFVSSIEITVITPGGAAGDAAIIAENPDGLTGESPNPFRYDAVAGGFQRADANMDGMVDLADAITILNFLFNDGTVSCEDAFDVNDDGGLNLADAIALLSYSFSDGEDPGPPFGQCGFDPTPDNLDCGSFPLCEQ